MRSVLFASFMVWSASCAQGQAGPAPQTRAPAGIIVGAQSNVCVSVHVDQRVWPTPLLPDSDRNFSGFLASELARLHRAHGGSYHLPGPRQIPRFVVNSDGANPACREAGQDIDLTVRYAPRPDGRPFVVTYRITQGANARTGVFSRDIEEEWRSGRLVRIHKTQPLQIAVFEDIRSKAEFFMHELTSGEGE